MLDVGADFDPEYLFEKIGSIVLEAFFEWSTSQRVHMDEIVFRKWQPIVTLNSTYFLEWLVEEKNIKAEKAYLLIRYLNPNSEFIKDYSTDIWEKYGKHAEELQENHCIDFKAFLLALGFNNPANIATELVSFSFESVHDAQSSNKLNERSWAFLRHHTPSPRFFGSFLFGDWDICERLRRGLVNKFVAYSWPEEKILETVKRENTLVKIIEYAESFFEGRQLLKRLKKKDQG